MVVEEIKTEGAVVRFHDDFIEDTKITDMRMERISQIITNSYKTRILQPIEKCG